MTNNTGWTAGRGQGLTFGTAMNAADIDSLATGHSVMSSVADIANQTYQDQFADVAVELVIASTTLAAGAALSLYIFDKYQIDGSTSYYGDNSLTSTGGTQEAYLPGYGLAGTYNATITGAAQTLVVATFRQVVLPTRAFRFALGNSLAVSLAASGHYVSYVTYNISLNS